MHIFVIINGVQVPTEEGHDGGGRVGDFSLGDKVAELEAEYSDNVVKTFIVCETPEQMEQFEKLIDKFCK